MSILQRVAHCLQLYLTTNKAYDAPLQVAAEGLRVAEELIRTMRPSPEQPVPPEVQVGNCSACSYTQTHAADALLFRKRTRLLAAFHDRTQRSGISFAVSQKLAKPLHDAILARLTAGDQDQEVKDSAISAMATELALLGDVLSAKLPDTLQVRPRQTSLDCIRLQRLPEPSGLRVQTSGFGDFQRRFMNYQL